MTSSVALVCSEAIRPQMAGIGIRYLEMARRLPDAGFDVVLISPDHPSSAAIDLPERVAWRPFQRGALGALTAGCGTVVAQGQLANDVVLELPETPVVVDLYDPWLVENFAYHETLGLDPYRNDHATWMLQLTRGDFFLCSSAEQRLFYLGLLTAVGRVNPESFAADHGLEALIALCPFGQPEELPPHRPLLPERRQGELRLLFGGLYDWYDPWPLLRALEAAPAAADRLYVVRGPDPRTPQRLFQEVEEWCRERGMWDERVVPLDWVPFERRYDLLRDVDALISTHRRGLETDLSLRTRFLDAFASGCPVVTTEGGAVSRLVAERGAGWVVPEGDADAVTKALAELRDEREVARRSAEARGLAEEFRWRRVLEPLVAFLRSPRRDPTKERFARPRATHAPPDSLGFRLRRKLRRLWGSAS